MKSTLQNLKRLETLITDASYTLRYEKGSFKTGFCILEDKKVVVVNKFFDLQAKINSLIDLIRELKINEKELSHPSKALYRELNDNSQLKIALS